MSFSLKCVKILNVETLANLVDFKRNCQCVISPLFCRNII